MPRFASGRRPHPKHCAAVRVGLAVVAEIFEEGIAQLVGPRGKHDPGRQAYTMAWSAGS